MSSMTKTLKLYNRIFPSKLYVVLDASGKVLEEAMADYSYQALEIGRVMHGERARTAMLKTDYLRLEKESKWLRAAARVEA